jgi:hypothetical protein
MTVGPVAGGTTVAAVVGVGGTSGGVGAGTAVAAGHALAFTGAPDVAFIGFAGFLSLVAGLSVRALVRRHGKVTP